MDDKAVNNGRGNVNKGEWYQVQKPSQKSSEGKKWMRMATNGIEAGAKQSCTLWVSSVTRTA